MAETIINSTQLRASGDTSSQTLIGANQIRQSGDSSAQTLLNKNQIAKTLKLTSVNGATYDSNYIFEKNGNNPNQYFRLGSDFKMFSIANSLTITLKFMVYEGNSVPLSNSAYNSANKYNVCVNNSGKVYVEFQDYKTSEFEIGFNTWCWLRMYKNANNTLLYVDVTRDGGRRTSIGQRTIVDSSEIIDLCYGLGFADNTDFKFKGKIDFKETDIFVNGKSILWI